MGVKAGMLRFAAIKLPKKFSRSYNKATVSAETSSIYVEELSKTLRQYDVESDLRADLFEAAGKVVPGSS